MDCRTNTAKALRMFLDTITALQSANYCGRNALDVLDQRVGWDLFEMARHYPSD
ncbi:hypothetical protein GGE66_000476 [Rhizobium leguminosarum]|uniref:Uncharacterized protein n=1 Tax=Rhizobium leguminosarum TaxID=384 RepID=A0A7W9ZPY6_RHILE|nr:hypothetical protein [Rhizobium leguminosarum]